jgi:hypothetical protein
VTTDGDSPDPQAGAGRNEEVESDEDSADLKLDAMRAVWLSMRDEEPPGRGLAELMAAARNQATATEPPPSLWQRALALVRRPPVLALASALVLIGGGAIVALRPAPPLARRDAAIVPQEPSAESAGSSVPTGQGSAMGAGSSVPTEQGSAMGAGSPTAPSLAAASTATTAVQEESAASVRGAAPPVPVAPRPTPVAPSSETSVPAPSNGQRASATKADTVAGRNNAGADAKANTEAAANRDASKTAPPAGEKRERAASPAPPVEVTLRGNSRRGTPHRPASHGGDDVIPSESSAPEAQGSQPSQPAPTARVEQLGKDCLAAAQRGDCATAYRLLGQISRMDQAYGDRLSKEAALTRCLE